MARSRRARYAKLMKEAQSQAEMKRIEEELAKKK